MLGDLEKIMLDAKTISDRLDVMAVQITEHYRGKEVTVLALLNGSLIFMADLLRRIPLPLQFDCLRVKSYYGGTKTTGHVEFDHQVLPDFSGRHILLLDDILDSGHTLAAVTEALEQETNPRSLKICVLLAKKRARERPVIADYVGFEIEDEFVVGYGLDFQEKYRNLPFIGVLKQTP